MNEIWVDIKEFEGYQISNSGEVKSLSRSIRYVHSVSGKEHFRTTKEKVLKKFINGAGYYFVTLRNNYVTKTCRIHVLVAENFITERPDGLVINHIDGNKLNNKVDNLEFVSRQRNTKHYYEMIGKSSGRIPIIDVAKIINRIANGEKAYKIAKEYNVSRDDITTVCKIIDLN